MEITKAEYRDGALMLYTNSPEARRFVHQFKPGDYDVTKAKQKRTLDANAYAWVLITKIASATMQNKDTVYRDYVKRGTVYKDFHLFPDEVNTFCHAWESLGTGWPTEKLDYTQDGERVTVRAYYGSSQYSRKQMARLIDDIIEDCKALDIETMPPDKLEALLHDW